MSPTNLKRILALASALTLIAVVQYIRPSWDYKPLESSPTSYDVVGELVRGLVVEYTFISPTRLLAGIDVKWATYKRINASRLAFELKDQSNGHTVAQGVVESADVPDWGFSLWRFKPIKTEPGQRFVLSISSPDAVPGSGLALLATRLATPGRVGFTVDGRPIRGSLPVRLVTAEPIPASQSPWFWLGLITAVCLAWVVWPDRPKRALEPVPALPSKIVIWGVAAIMTLSVSLACGLPNVWEGRRMEALGYRYMPLQVQDEYTYAEQAHKMGLGKRIFIGDPQAYESDDLITPYTGVVLPLGLLGLGDRLLGPIGLAYAVDFALPAFMVLLLFLGAVKLGASVNQATIMALALASFPHLAAYYMAGANDRAWSILVDHLTAPGTYFTNMGHPQMSGFFAVLAGLAFWRAHGLGGRGWSVAAAVSLGAIFYSDTPFQHIIIGSAGLATLATIFRRDWVRFKRSTAILTGAFIIGLPYWILLFLFIRQSETKGWVLEITDRVELFSLRLQLFEINMLLVVLALALIYTAILIKRRLRPEKVEVSDWTIDASFAPVWAFALLWMSDQITGINAQKHHYIWRGLAMWCPVFGTGWLWWHLERRFRGATGRKVVAVITVAVALLCVHKLIDYKVMDWSSTNFGTHRDVNPVTAIRPDMLKIIDILNREAQPDDVVLALDHAHQRQINTHTHSFVYINGTYNSLSSIDEKADRWAWGAALMGTTISPADYLHFMIYGLEVRGDAKRTERLKKLFKGQWRGDVWMFFGLRYKNSARRGVAKADLIFRNLKATGVTLLDSPYKLDWLVTGPIEKKMGAKPDPKWFEKVFEGEQSTLYRVKRKP